MLVLGPFTTFLPVTHSPPWMKTGPVNEDGNLSIGIRIVNSTIKGIPWELFGMALCLNGLDCFIYIYMGVSKNRGTPKWMVKKMEHSIKMDDLGGKPHYFRKHPYFCYFLEPSSIFLFSFQTFRFWRLDGCLKWEICLGKLVPSFGCVEMMMSFGGFNMRIIRYFEIYVRDQIVCKYSISDVTVYIYGTELPLRLVCFYYFILYFILP